MVVSVRLKDEAVEGAKELRFVRFAADAPRPTLRTSGVRDCYLHLLVEDILFDQIFRGV